jgi:uncharacterized damage-inducible protein DinB
LGALDQDEVKIMRTEQVRVLAEYNAWMNDKLYDVCATLSDEERKLDRGAFFHSLHGTLNHLLLGDLVWMGRFDGRRFVPQSLDQELYSSFEELRAQRVALDERISSWARSVTEADLDATLKFYSVVSKREHACALWKAVVHFFNHQTHHRGQLTALLSQAGVDYGVTDLMWLPGVLDD